MSHTPGPWEVVRHSHVDGDLWLSVNQHADAQGMKAWIAEIKYLTTEEERQWANARLISAAPDMLAALKDAVQTARNYYAMFHDETWKERLAKWDAAIAKAEGAQR